MQKYQSIITATNGSVIRNVPVTVLKEDGSLAEIFLDREGQVPASNPLATDSRGVFYFYAVNGRYSLRTSVDGITITDADAVLLNDPEELATAGPIAEAVAAAQAAAQQAQAAVDGSGIPELVAAAQNAVVDANNAVVQAQAAASLADTAKNESAAAKVAAENAQSGAQSASAQAGQARADAQTAAQAAAQSAASIDPAYLRNRANHTGTQAISTVTGLQDALDSKVDKVAGKQLSTEDFTSAEKTKLSGIATGATANASDANLRDRSTHTGAQPITTITGVVGTMGGGAVIERGSNANGEYVKFADGTQICTGDIVYANITTSVSAGVFMSGVSDVTFAAAFTDIPSCSVGITGSNGEGASWASTYAVYSSGLNTLAFCPTTGGVRYASFLAVGRWK